LGLILEFTNLDLDAAAGQTGRVVSDFIALLQVGDPQRHKIRMLVDDNYAARLKALTGFSNDKKTLLAMQRHLRERLQKIIEQANGPAEITLWELKGTVKFCVNPLTSQFFEIFIAETGDKDDPAQFIASLADFQIVQLIKDLGLHLRRFRVCEKCGAFFYQPTSREKKYCSVNCAGAARQARFRNRSIAKSNNRS